MSNPKNPDDPDPGGWNPPPPPIDARGRRPRRQRSGLQRALLVVLALFALLGVGFIAVALWALSQASDVEEAVQAGRTTGAQTDDAGCLAAALAELEKRQPRWLSVWETSFLTACLEECERTEAFCADVPESLTSEKGLAWSDARCRDVEAGSVACQSLLVLVQMHCTERRERARASGEG